jgi:hypothetical protein
MFPIATLDMGGLGGAVSGLPITMTIRKVWITNP